MNATTESALAPPMALQTRETSADVLAAGIKALVEARYKVAMLKPRDFDAVRERLLKACRRPFFAKQAEYNKPIGEGIRGPSIRFAEEVARCMTNMIVEKVTVFDDPQMRIVRVIVTDLEANFPWSEDISIRKTVERSKSKPGDVVVSQRVNSQGKPVYIIEATDDEIMNKEGALVSKAARNAILRLAPGDLVEEGMKTCVETALNADAKDPNAAKKEVFDAFSSKGVTVEQLKEYLGHDGTTLQAKELADLRSLYLAIKDGEATWRDAMETRGMAAPREGDEGKTLTDRIKEKAAAEKTTTTNTGGPSDAQVSAPEGAAPTVHEAPGKAAPAASAGKQRRF